MCYYLQQPHKSPLIKEVTTGKSTYIHSQTASPQTISYTLCTYVYSSTLHHNYYHIFVCTGTHVIIDGYEFQAPLTLFDPSLVSATPIER